MEALQGIEATNGVPPKTGDNLFPKHPSDNRQKLTENLRRFATGTIHLFAYVFSIVPTMTRLNQHDSIPFLCHFCHSSLFSLRQRHLSLTKQATDSRK